MASVAALQAIEGTFADVLGIEAPPHDLDVVDAGLLDSLMVITLLAELEAIFSIRIPFEELDLAEIRTIAGIADLVDRQPHVPRVEYAKPADECVMLLRGGDARTPVFLVPGSPGNPIGLRPLAHALDTDRPIYGLAAQALAPGQQPRVEDMAEEYLRVIKPLVADGRYMLGGSSFGGLVAFEMARRLARAGAEVEHLILLDTRVDPHGLGRLGYRRFQLGEAMRAVRYVAGDPKPRVRGALRMAARTLPGPGERPPLSASAGELAAAAEGRPPPVGVAGRSYRPGTYGGDVTLMVTQRVPIGVVAPARVWADHVEGRLSIVPIPGEHGRFLTGRGLGLIARHVSAVLEDGKPAVVS